MKDIIPIIQKEWGSFVGSEKGLFAIYAILILVWSFLPFNNLGTFALSGTVWWLFFSVIISGNFSNSAFVAERMNGSMEILLTAGFSRFGVLVGKMMFVIVMSVIIGCLCFSLSLLWVSLLGREGLAPGQSVGFTFVLYVAGTFMNVCAGAWLSIRLSSPRLIPFINILIVGIVCVIFYSLYYSLFISEWALIGLLGLGGFIFCFAAIKDFESEKIIAPIDV